MAYLAQKDQDKIEHDLKEVITSKLLNGFANRKFQPVIKVDSINLDFEIDENESDRDKIMVKSIKAHARVWVELKDNVGQTNNQLQLNVKEAKFLYDTDSKEFRISEEDQIELIDMSN